MHARPLPVSDLHERVLAGLARGGALLTGEERAVVDVLLALPDAPALLLARLASRRGPAWRLPELSAAGVDDLPAAASVLLDLGLLSDDVDWGTRAALATREVLAAGCRRLGLPVGGARAALISRLAGAMGAVADGIDVAPELRWDDAVWVRLRCAPLLLRLSRWATLEVWPDLSAPVLERLGLVRWPAYAPTPAGASVAALVEDRATWDAWERLVDGWAELDADAVLAALDLPRWPPGRLDLRRALGDVGLHLADGLRRAGEVEPARALLVGLAARTGPWQAEAVVRLVRLTGRGGHPERARAIAVEAWPHLDPAGRIALQRTIRAIPGAGALPPGPPLRSAPTRSVRLSGAPAASPHGEAALATTDAVDPVRSAAGSTAARGEAAGRVAVGATEASGVEPGQGAAGTTEARGAASGGFAVGSTEARGVEPGQGAAGTTEARGAASGGVAVELTRGDGGRGSARPRFGPEAETVERAVVRALAAVGRAALFAEGELWRTLLALLFADLMFLPVEGQLPVPFLSGPLDFGTPAFASRRRAEVDAVWREIEAGGAAARVASAWDRWAGVRLRGARWEVADREVMCAVAAAMPGAALRRVLEPLLHGGSRAARGLPDLVVLPGALAQLPDALPSVIRPSLLLVELKTEHDQLRDEQAVWHDRLIEAGVRVELWEVTTRPG